MVVGVCSLIYHIFYAKSRVWFSDERTSYILGAQLSLLFDRILLILLCEYAAVHDRLFVCLLACLVLTCLFVSIYLISICFDCVWTSDWLCVFICLSGCLFMHLIRSKIQMIQIVHAMQWCNSNVYNFQYYFFFFNFRTVTIVVVVFVFFLFNTMGIRTKVWWCRNVGKINVNIHSAADYDMRTRNHYDLGSYNNDMHQYTHIHSRAFLKVCARGGKQFSQHHRAK